MQGSSVKSDATITKMQATLQSLLRIVWNNFINTTYPTINFKSDVILCIRILSSLSKFSTEIRAREFSMTRLQFGLVLFSLVRIH